MPAPQLSNKVPPSIQTAMNTDSARTTATGWQPIVIIALSEVLVPRATIEVTRHQRDKSTAKSWIAAGTTPLLLSATRAQKPTMNSGNDARPALEFSLRKIIANANTTGTSMATRKSLVTGAISPVYSDIE